MSKKGAASTVAVAQIGARMHYAVPEILLRNGLLYTFHTDILAPQEQWLAPLKPLGGIPLMQRFLGRKISSKLRAQTRQSPVSGLWHICKLKNARTPLDRLRVFHNQADHFQNNVVRGGIDGAEAVYSFTTASARLLEYARVQGIHGFLEQYIASQPMSDNLLTEERRRFPEWEPSTEIEEDYSAYYARLRREWDLADTILCPSDYVAQSLVNEGVDATKLTIVPYGVDLPNIERPMPGAHQGRKLRILFVGKAELRKGVHYLADALGRLPKNSYEARIVGSSRLTQAGSAQLREVADLVGPVPRSKVWEYFAWADVFVLPSLVEGSATVTYEALACGLPVICTPNTGSVVRDGKTGFIVEPFSGPAIAEALTQLLDAPNLLDDMKSQVWLRRAEVSLERYEEDLVGTIRARLLADQV